MHLLYMSPLILCITSFSYMPCFMNILHDIMGGISEINIFSIPGKWLLYFILELLQNGDKVT